MPKQKWLCISVVGEPFGHLGTAYIPSGTRVPGCGTDDQGKGIYKAMTGSRKYALILIFNLTFGDEPEEVKTPTQPEKEE